MCNFECNALFHCTKTATIELIMQIDPLRRVYMYGLRHTVAAEPHMDL